MPASLTVLMADTSCTDACRAVLASLQRIARRRGGRIMHVRFASEESWAADSTIGREEAVVLLLTGQGAAARRLLTFWESAAEQARRRRPALPVAIAAGAALAGSIGGGRTPLLPAVAVRDQDVYVEHGGIVSLDSAAEAALASAVDALLPRQGPEFSGEFSRERA